MVLGKPLLIALGLALWACGQPTGQSAATGAGQVPREVPSNAKADQASFRGYTVDIVEAGAECSVEFSGSRAKGRIVLALKPPCRFVRMPADAKAVQSAHFADVEHATVLIIVGTPNEADPAARLTSGVYCGTRSRGVLLRDASVVLSTRIAAGRKCVNGEDEQEFWLFAHPGKPR